MQLDTCKTGTQFLNEANKFYPSMKSLAVDANVDPFLLAETVHSICAFFLLDQKYKIFPYEFQAGQLIQETNCSKAVLSMPQGSIHITKEVRLYFRGSNSKCSFFLVS